MEYILETFRITNEEYKELDARFGDLAHFAAWQLVKKNVKNNHTDEPEDIVQELRMAIMRAGSYFKRQVYLEACMKAVREHCTHIGGKLVLESLEDLWLNRTKHGANKQKFGLIQEDLLEQLVRDYVPVEHWPNKQKKLEINTKFSTYAKSIVWNSQRALGKKISKNKAIRAGQVSLSCYDYLVSVNGKVSLISNG